MILTLKQTKALDLLEDNKTIEVYYGGAAGGGKSAIGSYWQLKRRLKYPGTKGLLGRAQLKTLKETTLQTFFDIAKMQGVVRGYDFDLTSSQDKQYPNCLIFQNGSLIYLKDLFAYPSDPDFDELGSLELTDAFIDEAPQITSKAKGIVRSRIRYKLDEFGLIPKMLMCGNPSKNWAYYDFYSPYKNNELREDRAFIQALPNDNKNLPKSYIESLMGLEKNSRERLLFGNWEYDDDPAALISYDRILYAFKNTELPSGDTYLSCDVARFGKDKTVIGLWRGYRVELFEFKGLKVTEVADKIKWFMNEYNIPVSRVVADEDGVGGGVVDILGCVGFVNNASPIGSENYRNLKSQCYYKMSERMNKNGIYINCDNSEIKGDIIQELENVKQHNMDKDGKKEVLPKDKVKEIIGRSPDYSDTIMMREVFNLAPTITWGVI
jgi:phage terminase large subunit